MYNANSNGVGKVADTHASYVSELNRQPGALKMKWTAGISRYSLRRMPKCERLDQDSGSTRKTGIRHRFIPG